MENIAEIKNLYKDFKGLNAHALDNISIYLPKGQLIGLAGPDGAGKTTLIRLLLGLFKPTNGKISVLGLDPITQTHQLHQKIGYMPQKFGLYEDLSIAENMNLYADLKGLSTKERQDQFAQLLN